jgi:hypothetical protein
LPQKSVTIGRPADAPQSGRVSYRYPHAGKTGYGYRRLRRKCAFALPPKCFAFSPARRRHQRHARAKVHGQPADKNTITWENPPKFAGDELALSLHLFRHKRRIFRAVSF